MALLRPLAYLSLPFLVLRYLASRSPVAKYYVRVALYISTLGICSLWGVLTSIAMSIAGNRFNINYVTARSFYALSSRVLGIRFNVQGEEYLEVRPAVLVGNHQSMLDIIYLGRIFPRYASIMAKRELRWTPLLGQYMAASGAVFVDRSNNTSAVHSLAEAGDKMKSQGTSLWLFPEGTRSMREHSDLLPFKKGAFHLAVQAGVPIIPVVCENYWKLYRKNVFDSGTLTIRVLPPIPTTNLTAADVGELTTRTRDAMLEALRDIAGEAPPSTTSPLPTSQDTPPAASDDHASRPEEEASRMEPESMRKRVLSAVSTTSRSDAGAETEEDEGMVLVGRPQ